MLHETNTNMETIGKKLQINPLNKINIKPFENEVNEDEKGLYLIRPLHRPTLEKKRNPPYIINLYIRKA